MYSFLFTESSERAVGVSKVLRLAASSSVSNVRLLAVENRRATPIGFYSVSGDMRFLIARCTL